MEKDGPAALLCVIFFTAVQIFVSSSRVLLKFLGLFCAMYAIFANFAQFWAFFAHILFANFSHEVLRVLFCKLFPSLQD